MKAFLWVTLLVLHLSLSEPSVCLSHPPPLNLIEPDFKVNKDFSFQIHNYANSVSISSTSKGIFFHGDFSKIILSAAAGSVHEYRTTRFSFKYPPQHRMAEVSQ